MPDFFVRVREQVCDLVFKRSRIDDFAQRSVRCQGQQISRHIKSPRPQGAVVAFLLHLRGLRRDAHEIMKDLLGKRFVFGKQTVDCFAIQRPGLIISPEIWRVISAFLGVLVASRTLLAVPSLLVGYGNAARVESFSIARAVFARSANQRWPYP